MAGHARSKRISNEPYVNQRTRRRHAANPRRWGALVQIASEAGLNFGEVRSIDDLAEAVVQRVHEVWCWSIQEANEVPVDEFWVQRADAHGNTLVEPHPAIQFEAAMRVEVLDVIDRFGKLDIEQRKLILAEGQATMIEMFVREVVRRIELTPAQKKRLGPAMRDARPALEEALAS